MSELAETESGYWPRPLIFFDFRKAHPALAIPLLTLVVIYVLCLFITAPIVIRHDLARFAEHGFDVGELQAQGHLDSYLLARVVVVDGFLMLINPFMIALIGWWWAKMSSPTIRFRQILGLMLAGEIFYGIGRLIEAGVIYARDSTEISLSPAPLAAALGLSPDGRLHAALSQLNIFLIVEIILVGFGMAALLGCSRRRGYFLALFSVGLFPGLRLLWRIAV